MRKIEGRHARVDWRQALCRRRGIWGSRKHWNVLIIWLPLNGPNWEPSNIASVRWWGCDPIWIAFSWNVSSSSNWCHLTYWSMYWNFYLQIMRDFIACLIIFIILILEQSCQIWLCDFRLDESCAIWFWMSSVQRFCLYGAVRQTVWVSPIYLLIRAYISISY